MIDEPEDINTIYEVVVNHEEQYSIWPRFKGNPPLGWKTAGKTGSKQDCLAYISEVWTDMRPLSLRRKMQEQNASKTLMPTECCEAEVDPRDNIVNFLAQGDHPLCAGTRPDIDLAHFNESLARGYTHVRFTDTRGETVLGFQLDAEGCQIDQTAIEKAEGVVHLEGYLKLNYQKVKCIADIDLRSLSGNGHLQIIDKQIE